MRYTVPASLWHRPKPSVAWAFGGLKVHRTFTCYRLTHWSFILFRFAHGLFQQPASRASRWACTPLAVTPVCACVSVTTPLYWGSTEPQPQGLVVGACGHTQRLGEFRGCFNGLY